MNAITSVPKNKEQGNGTLIGYITAGDPNPERLLKSQMP